MRRLLLIIGIVAGIWFCLAAKSAPVLNVGMDKQFPPYEFVGKGGKIQGLNVDILRAISADTGLKFSFKAGEWEAIRADFNQGKIQLLAGLIKTTEREKHYIFTQPHTYIHYAVFVRRDSPLLAKWSDLKGKKILVQAGDVMDEVLQEKKLGAVLLYVADFSEAMQKLSDGAGDAVLMPKVQGFAYIAEHQLDNLVDSGNLGYAMPYCIALLPEQTELCTILDRSIDKLNSENKLRSIQNKWFGVYDGDATTLDKHQSIYRLILLFTILGLLIVAYRGYVLVKRLMRQKHSLAQLIAERNNYELEFNRRNQLFVTGPVVFMKWSDNVREMFESISGNLTVFGYNPHEILTGKIPYRSVIHPDDLEWILADRISHLEQHIYSYCQTYRIICPAPDADLIANRDGVPQGGEPVTNLWKDRNAALARVEMVQIRWVYDFTVIIPDDFTHTNHFYGYLMDISQQKLFESELKQQHAAAQVAIQTKDTFLIRFTNEIYSPLNDLMNRVRKSSNLALPEEQSQAIQTISQSATNLNRVLLQIQDFLDILKGSMGSVPRWYVLNPLLEKIITEYQVLLAGKKIGFEYHVFHPETMVFLDCDWFQKVLSIVLDNASKFTHAGKISLTIDLSSESESKAELLVKVADTGVGIPPDKLSMIMEPFTQVDESNTRRYGGIGLGLSIAHNLLIQMSGKIYIKSLPGVGTTVELRFPVDTKKATLE